MSFEKKYKVLYIDDEVSMRKLINYILIEEGHIPIEAKNGNEGLLMARSHNPNVIILDLSLPDMSGIEILKELRQWTKIPVIILTANKMDDDKVQLLDLGADDYLVKPFHGPELLARIRVAIRHSEKNKEDPLITLNGLEIDLASHIVKVFNNEIKLTSKEYEFLVFLAKNAGKIVTQKQVLDAIWGKNNEDNSHYLRVYAAQLRKKIELPLNRKIIYTIPGIGYRLQVSE